MRRTAARQLDIISYEAVNDIDLRARLRAARGFCTRHAWQFLEETRDPLGTALIYRDIINTLAAAASGQGERDGVLGLALRAYRALRRRDARWLSGIVSPTVGCLICAAERETEDLYLTTLVREMAANASFSAIWSRSDGLCWPHLSAAGARTKERRVRDSLSEPWLRRFGSAREPADATAAVTHSAHLIAAVHGSHIAPRTALPPDLIVDVQRRQLAATDRPLDEVAPDCVVCRQVRAEGARGSAAASDLSVLCATHAWERLRAGQSASPDLLASVDRVARAKAADSERGGPTGVSISCDERATARWRLSPSCPACADWLGASLSAIERASQSGATLAPLCLGHQLLGLNATTGASAVVSATGAQVRFWRELSAELAECIRKHDYRFLREPRGSEQISPWRAVDLIAGPRGLP